MRAHLLFGLFFLALGAGCGNTALTSACTTNRDCPSGRACLSGVCTPLSGPGAADDSCTRDDQCTNGLANWCDTAELRCKVRPTARDAGIRGGKSDDGGEVDPPVDGGFPVLNPDAGPARDAGTPGGRDGGLPVPTTCNNDMECSGRNADTACIQNRCQVRCDRPQGVACRAPQVCGKLTGHCVTPNMALGAACTDDEQCSSALCLGLMSAMAGGPTTSVCTQACSATSNCPLRFTCTSVSGMSMCLGESLFSGAQFSTAPGGTCTSASRNTCQSGSCDTVNRVCMQSCSRDADCSSFGGACSTYSQTDSGGTTIYEDMCTDAGALAGPGSACQGNADCDSGVCLKPVGACGKHCCSDADCASGQTCGIYDLDAKAATFAKVCMPKPAGAGTRPLGAACTRGGDCSSQICLARDPSDATSPQQCSTLCCTDADCSVLPNGGRCRPFGGPQYNGVSTIVGACQPN